MWCRPYVAYMYLMHGMRCSHVWNVSSKRCTPWVQQSSRRSSLGRCDVASSICGLHVPHVRNEVQPRVGSSHDAPLGCNRATVVAA
mgnify:CR=1 FL=1|jgi:hypothetical protein